MQFLKKQIDSNITFDEEVSLYKLVLPGITRYFESICFFIDHTKKLYGEQHYFENISYPGDIIIGVSSFYNYKIYCFIDLDNLSSNYFFVLEGKIFDFTVKTNRYYCFIGKDFSGEYVYYSNLDNDNFSFCISDDRLELKNDIFGTVVWEKKLICTTELSFFPLYRVENLERGNISLADFYIFDDFFNTCDGFSDLYKFLDFLGVISEKYDKQFFPKIVIPVYSLDESFLVQIRKLLFSFLYESGLSYLSENTKIHSVFSSYFKDMSGERIDDFDMDISLPENIFSFDPKYAKFKNDLLILCYNYFSMSSSLSSINNSDFTNSDNAYLLASKNSLSVTKKSLEESIEIYDRSLRGVFEMVSERIKKS